MAVGTIAFVRKGQPVLGLILGLAMLCNMMIAARAGAGVPLLSSRLKIDPTVFVTTFTDVLGSLLFFGLLPGLLT